MQQFELHDFGTQVRITPPDPDEVVDASELTAAGITELGPSLGP